MHPITDARWAQLILVALLITSIKETTFAQSDPLQRQREATARIDAIVERFRRAGEMMRLDSGELRDIGTQLDTSNNVLRARQDWATLATGCMKRGHIHRLQTQWSEAVVAYTCAVDAGTRAGNLALQSDALGWRSVAEWSRNNAGPAASDAAEAVRLAGMTDDKNVLARALQALGNALITQQNFAAAAETVSRHLDAARLTSDPAAVYYALLNRSEVYLGLAGQCDDNDNFDTCGRLLDLAQIDLQNAANVVQAVGLDGLVQQAGELRKDVATRRTIVDLRRSITGDAVPDFHPKTPTDVLVTENFLPRATSALRATAPGLVSTDIKPTVWRLCRFGEGPGGVCGRPRR